MMYYIILGNCETVLKRLLWGVWCKAPHRFVKVFLLPGVDLRLQLWRHRACKVKIVGEYLACVMVEYFFLPLQADGRGR
jgi:hypothetical protein